MAPVQLGYWNIRAVRKPENFFVHLLIRVYKRFSFAVLKVRSADPAFTRVRRCGSGREALQLRRTPVGSQRVAEREIFTRSRLSKRKLMHFLHGCFTETMCPVFLLNHDALDYSCRITWTTR